MQEYQCHQPIIWTKFVRFDSLSKLTLYLSLNLSGTKANRIKQEVNNIKSKTIT